jgi:hypothetical protein
MKQLIIFTILISSFCTNLYSQEYETLSKNAISLNAPAFNRLFSINYERTIRQKKWKSIAGIGFYHLPLNESTKSLTAMFLGMDFLQGKKVNYLDLGASLIVDKLPDFLILSEDRRRLGLTLIPKIGYRRQKKMKGFFFRGIVMPFILDITPKEAIDQETKNYFILRSSAGDLISFGVGYNF